MPMSLAYSSRKHRYCGPGVASEMCILSSTQGGEGGSRFCISKEAGEDMRSSLERVVERDEYWTRKDIEGNSHPSCIDEFRSSASLAK
jgi:hypothetical protein